MSIGGFFIVFLSMSLSEIIGQGLFFSAFLVPIAIIVIPVIRAKDFSSKLLFLVMGIIIGGILGFLLFKASIYIVFKDGMGPV